MNEKIHIDNSTLGVFVNDGTMEKDAFDFVQKHLFVDCCQVCKQKYNMLLKLNATIHLKRKNPFSDETNGEEAQIIVCVYSEMIKDFIDKKLPTNERELFYLHLDECEDCRNFLSILTTTEMPTKDK